MKTKSIKLKNFYSFSKIYFLKNKKKTTKSIGNFTQIHSKLKFVIKKIYFYNKYGKVIWFLGFSSPKNYKTRHIFLPKSVYIQGLISNNKFLNLIVSKVKKTYTLTLSKPDLLVIYGLDKNSALLVKEFNKSNIPVIVIGSTFSRFKCSILITINLNLKELHSFFSFIIHSVLKKY